MSINPVPGIGSATDPQSASAGHRAAPSSTAGARAESTQSNSGTAPKQEIQKTQKTPAPAAEPQDEVQVQRDQETNGEIVIRYLDRSGDVILQVPSSQVLDVTRAIDANLQQEAKVRTDAGTAPAANQGGKIYGD
jgi:uncharacterized FlaG/YvyC family protein